MSAILDLPDCHRCGMYIREPVQTEDDAIALCELCRGEQQPRPVGEVSSQEIDRQLQRIRALKRRFPHR